MWRIGIVVFLLLAIAALIADFSSKKSRSKPRSWYPVFWIPLCGVLSYVWILTLCGSTGSGDWSVKLGPFIIAICISPTLLILAALLWFYPRQWDLAPVGIGVGICFFIFCSVSRSITIVVTDRTGKPIPGLEVGYNYPNLVTSTYYGTAITDGKGQVTAYTLIGSLTFGSNWFNAEVHTPQYPSRTNKTAWLGVSFQLRSGDQIDSRMFASWNHPFGRHEERVYMTFFDDGYRNLKIPLIAAREDEPLDLGLPELWRKHWPNWPMCDLTWKNLINLDAYLRSGIRKQSHALGLGEQEPAHTLYLIWSYAKHIRSNDNERYEIQLCNYLLGYAPQTRRQRAEALRLFAEQRAAQLLQVIEPELMSGHGSYLDIEELGPLARPLAPKFGKLYAAGNESSRRSLLETFRRVGPPPEDVLFALVSRDTEAIDSFTDAMRSRAAEDSEADVKVVDSWIAQNPNILTKEQLDRLREAFANRRSEECSFDQEPKPIVRKYTNGKRIDLICGGDQPYEANSVLPLPLVLLVTDPNGDSVPNTPVEVGSDDPAITFSLNRDGSNDVPKMTLLTNSQGEVSVYMKCTGEKGTGNFYGKLK